MLKRTQLRKWQAAAAEKVARGSLVLAAQPGAGKTITLLTGAADALRSGHVNRVLLVAPRLILDTVFPAEAESWEHTAHLSFSMAHRYTNRDRARAMFENASHIVTSTPDTLASLLDEINDRGSLPFDCIMVDESQAFRTPDATRTKVLHALSEACSHIVLSSGTPTPNGPADAWSPGRLVAPDEPFWDADNGRWHRRHFRQVSAFGWRPKPGAEKLINDKLAEIGVSIRLDQTADIPAALYSNYPFEHAPKHKELIRDFTANGTVTIRDEAFGTEGEEGGFLIRLQELTNGFAYLGEGEAQRTEILSMARVEALKDVIDSSVGPVLVATGFKADITMIRRAYPMAVVYSGTTPVAERANIIKRWNADQIPVLLGHPGAMGHGLNLQLGSAQTIVWFSCPFSWEKFAQLNARLIRTGQKKSVSVVRLQSDVGIDHAVASVLDRKQSGEKALIEALNITKKVGSP